MSGKRYEVLVKTALGLKFERYSSLASARQDFDHITRTAQTPSGHVSVEAWLIDRRPAPGATTGTLDYWLKEQ